MMRLSLLAALSTVVVAQQGFNALKAPQTGLAAAGGGNQLLNMAIASCDVGEKSCGPGCIPTGGQCCSAIKGAWCSSGQYCFSQGCCDKGKVCSGSPTGCSDSSKVLCGNYCIPKGSVCCTTGYCDAGETCTSDGRCRAGGSSSGGGSSGGSSDRSGDNGPSFSSTAPAFPLSSAEPSVSFSNPSVSAPSVTIPSSTATGLSLSSDSLPTSTSSSSSGSLGSSGSSGSSGASAAVHNVPSLLVGILAALPIFL